MPKTARVPETFWDRTARAAFTKLVDQFQGDRILLREADQTRVAGSRDRHATESIVEVHQPRTYRRILTGGSLGAAEAYLDGDWSSPDLTGLLRAVIRNLDTARRMDGGMARVAGMLSWLWHLCRRNTRSGSRRNIEAHYDLGNDFFRLFLDDTMLYSSGIFERPDSTLREASVAKIDRLCRMLDLQPSDHLLEIGTGWGGFALHAARHYGCEITTTTISREQFDLASQRVRDAGLEDQIHVVLQDYRDLRGHYDKLVSIEMIEAVGHEYLPTYFGQCSRLLKRDGLMALQAIVMNEQRYPEYLRSTDFIQKYIFPGGCLPSITSMGQAVARATDMRMLQVEDFAPHYAQTLRCWRQGFWGAIDQIREMGFTERFIRMWHYYFCYCEAAFDERFVGVVQLLLAKPRQLRDLQRDQRWMVRNNRSQATLAGSP